MAKQAPSGAKRPGPARAKGPTPRGTSPKAAARAAANRSNHGPAKAPAGPAKSVARPGRAASADHRATAKEAPRGGAKTARSTSGRFTPKATRPVAPPPVSTGRYTPPIPRNKRTSPPWVPVLMLSLLILGAMAIVLDYLGVLPFGTSSWYLLAGLVLVAAGFGVATQYR